MNEIAERTTQEVVGVPELVFTPDQVKLIKETVAKGTTDDEFALFLYTCKATGLNPLLRQIHAVKRWDSKLEREAMAIQTGIDGYRLNAERTGKYSPGRETTFAYKTNDSILSATAYVQKKVDGEWHEVAATAFFAEYVQTKKDGTPNSMWAKMPHSQISKCAEALALRKAFPKEMGPTRTEEEMDQADNLGEAKPALIASPVAKDATPIGGGMAANLVTFIPAAVSIKTGTNEKGTWKKYGIKDPQGEWYGTFDEKLGQIAVEAKETKRNIIVQWEIKGQYKEVVTLKYA